MSQSIRDDAVAALITYMKNRGRKGSASEGVYSGHVRLNRANISSMITVQNDDLALPVEFLAGLTMNPSYDDTWEKFKELMGKWCNKESKTSRRSRWIMLPSTIKHNKKEWSVDWSNNPRMTGPVNTDIETTMKTAMVEEVKANYTVAMNGFVDSFTKKGVAEYEHGTEREMDYDMSNPKKPKLVQNKDSQKGSYTDIAIKKAMKKALKGAQKNMSKFSKNDIVSMSDIFNGFLIEHLGATHKLKKNRVDGGLFDTLEFIAEIVLEDNNVQNPGHLNRAITKAFQDTFSGTGNASEGFKDLMFKYLSVKDLSEVERLWTSSDTPTVAIQKLAKSSIGVEFKKIKGMKLTPALSKRARKDTKKNTGSVKGKKVKTSKKKAGKAKPFRPRSFNTKTSAATSQASSSAILLKELINQALPEVMLLKMQLPALRNRTGRFRQSAEVTNVLIGPRGGTNIEYTYMKDPYQTFEPGGEMGSRNRDPRKIIGESIREIAIRATGNKFITTRSK